MTQNKDRPLVYVAALCEHVLDEKDNVLSAIRFADRIQANLPADTPDDFLIPIRLAALVMMRAGTARGKRLLSLKVIDPEGKDLPPSPAFPLVFTEENQGANTIIRIMLAVKVPGLYRFDVTLDDEVIAQMPLDLVLIRETEQQPEPTSPV